jgi:C4-dicarboxylate transporter, DctQ subunit
MTEKRLPTILRLVYGIENGLLVLALSVMIFLSFGQIVLRNVFSASLAWIDPLLRYLVLWVGMLGAMVATREDNHISIDVISFFLPGRGRVMVRIVTDLFTAGICGVLAYAGVLFVRDEMSMGMEAFDGVPNWVIEVILPFAFAVIAIRYAIYFGLHIYQAIVGVPEEPEKPEEPEGVS